MLLPMILALSVLGVEPVTVGPAGADILGHTNREIQAAVDRVAQRGGGVVRVLAGTYDMEDSLHLRTGVTVRGAGDKTILKKLPAVSSPLSADLGYGHYDVSLAEPERFHVGMGVVIRDDRSGGFYNTVATLTWRNGDRFGISRMLNHDYSRRNHATVTSLFPIVSGYHLKDAAVEDILLDGDKEHNSALDGCRGGGVFLLQAHNVVLRRVHVKDYASDGISFQQCRHTTIENCLLEGMTGCGLHPGSGSVGAVMRHNTSRGNGADGIFYCLRVSFSACEDNLIEGNGGTGISIGGRDTDHQIARNTIRGNGRAGIFFRPGDEAMAGSRNRLEANQFDGNCRKEGLAEIEIRGETRDVHVLNNVFRPATDRPRPVPCLSIDAQADRIVAAGNRVEGGGALTIDNHAAASALSEKPPAQPLAVGPECAPQTAAAHLDPPHTP